MSYKRYVFSYSSFTKKLSSFSIIFNIAPLLSKENYILIEAAIFNNIEVYISLL